MTVEELLRSVGPDATLIAEGGRITFANGAAHALLGAAPGALEGTALSAHLPAAELERVETILGQRAQGQGDLPETFRLRLRRAGDGEVTVDARFAAAGDARVLTLRDATERARAEGLMGRVASLTRRGQSIHGADALLDAAEPIFAELGWRGAFVRLLPDGSQTLRALAAPKGDAVGDYARSLIGKQIPLDRTPVVKEVLDRGQAVFLDNIPSFLAGPVSAAQKLSESLERSHTYRSAWCPVRSGDGTLTHLLALAGRGMNEHDFVALQLFAAQLGEAIDLAQLRAELVRQERLAAVGEMAAVLAHEVRNPLGVVFNAVAGLKRLVTGEPATSLLGSLAEEAERLRRLMADLLDFARPSQPVLEPLAVDQLLREAVQAAQQDPTRPHEAVVELQLPAGLPRVAADGALLRRALVNLLVNAMQHVPERGRVTVSAERAGDSVRLRVHNEGASIPANVASRVFEPFFTTRASGAGLGLAVVRRVMEDLGGTVSHEPTPTGVSFVLTVRAASQAA